MMNKKSFFVYGILMFASSVFLVSACGMPSFSVNKHLGKLPSMAAYYEQEIASLKKEIQAKEESVFQGSPSNPGDRQGRAQRQERIQEMKDAMEKKASNYQKRLCDVFKKKKVAGSLPGTGSDAIPYVVKDVSLEVQDGSIVMNAELGVQETMEAEDGSVQVFYVAVDSKGKVIPKSATVVYLSRDELQAGEAVSLSREWDMSFLKHLEDFDKLRFISKGEYKEITG